MIKKYDSIMVTGASSMIGISVLEYLNKFKQDFNIIPVYHKDVNLLEKEELESFLLDNRIDGIIHLAGYNGGIEWNRLYPADIFYNTAQIALNVLNAGQRFGAKKIISVLASCSYPDQGDSVLEEDSLWRGECNPSVECHGLSKRILEAYSRQISKQYATQCISAVLTNCYGPHDSYHPQKTKVVGAMIKKIHDAVKNNIEEIEFWGDGSPLRELMYSKDAAECIVETFLHYEDTTKPINIGSNEEVSIKKLANTIAKALSYKGKIKWDTTKQNGQMRKKLNTEKMNSLFSFSPTPLEKGIKNTVDWFSYQQGVNK